MFERGIMMQQKEKIHLKYKRLPILHSSPIGFNVITNRDLQIQIDKIEKPILLNPIDNY
jgi:hypothetical protein